jgi:uncharacterized membrane protein YccF (DUF307 family)
MPLGSVPCEGVVRAGRVLRLEVLTVSRLASIAVGRGPAYRDPVRTIGNILWFLLAGWWLALGYVLAGLLAIVLIITIPFGIASFRLAGYVVWPFGRTVVVSREAGIWSLVGNVIWIILFGWELALIHLAAGLLLCVTIIGIPFGVACWKMVPLALVPLGTRVVPVSSVDSDRYGVPLGKEPASPA